MSFDVLVKLVLAELESAQTSLEQIDSYIAICSLVVDIKQCNDRELVDYALLWNWPLERVEAERSQMRRIALLVCNTHFPEPVEASQA